MPDKRAIRRFHHGKKAFANSFYIMVLFDTQELEVISKNVVVCKR